MKSYVIILISLITLLIPTPHHSNAQTSSPLWVYSVIASDEANTLVKVYPDSGRIEPVFSLPAITEESLTELAPDEAAVWLETFGETDYGGQVTWPLKITIESITPSPDRSMVALHVDYSVILHANTGWSWCRFGFSKIIVVSGETGEQIMTWQTNLHSWYFFPDAQRTVEYYVFIKSPMWTWDQQALVIGLGAYQPHYVWDYAILMLPLNNPEPILVGQAITWAVSPNENRLSFISREIGTVRDTLHNVRFDLHTGTLVSADYSLGNYVILGYPETIAYLAQSPFFRIAYDWRLTEVSINSGGLGRLDANETIAFYDIDIPFRPYDLRVPYIHYFQAIGDRVLIQNTDHSLSIASLSDGSIHIEPLVAEAVVYWEVVDTNTLIVQLSQNATYQVIHLN